MATDADDTWVEHTSIRGIMEIELCKATASLKVRARSKGVTPWEHTEAVTAVATKTGLDITTVLEFFNDHGCALDTLIRKRIITQRHNTRRYEIAVCQLARTIGDHAPDLIQYKPSASQGDGRIRIPRKRP